MKGLKAAFNYLKKHHRVFEKKDFESLATDLIQDSDPVLPTDRSAIFQMRQTMKRDRKRTYDDMCAADGDSPMDLEPEDHFPDPTELDLPQGEPQPGPSGTQRGASRSSQSSQSSGSSRGGTRGGTRGSKRGKPQGQGGRGNNPSPSQTPPLVIDQSDGHISGSSNEEPFASANEDVNASGNDEVVVDSTISYSWLRGRCRQNANKK